MRYIERDGTTREEENGQDRLLAALYTHKAGRILLKPFIGPTFSNFMGRLMDSGASARLIPHFIRTLGIDMTEYEEAEYRTYNEFFTRRIQAGARPVDPNPDHLISPADGKLSVYPITAQGRVFVKHTPYTVKRLLKSSELARRYEDGYLFLIRLTVDDYHRYTYAADGVKCGDRKIPGRFHTVNPIANEYEPIYKENTRVYTKLCTKRFGDLIQMEVGAMCVGRIVNYLEAGAVKKGEEKGRFEFGGSTVIVMVQKDKVKVRSDLLLNTSKGYETRIHLGDMIAEAL